MNKVSRYFSWVIILALLSKLTLNPPIVQAQSLPDWLNSAVSTNTSLEEAYADYQSVMEDLVLSDLAKMEEGTNRETFDLRVKDRLDDSKRRVEELGEGLVRVVYPYQDQAALDFYFYYDHLTYTACVSLENPLQSPHQGVSDAAFQAWSKGSPVEDLIQDSTFQLQAFGQMLADKPFSIIACLKSTSSQGQDLETGFLIIQDGQVVKAAKVDPSSLDHFDYADLQETILRQVIQ